MRILLVSSSSGSRGGGEIFLLYLAAALKAAGHTVGLWVARHPRMDDLARQFAPLGDVIRADYQNTYDRWHRGLLTFSSSATRRQFVDAWMSWQPDVVHLNKQNLEDGLDLLAATADLPVPHLCTIHITQSAQFLGARFPAWRDAGARRALQRYRGMLVAVAPTRAAELAAFIGSAAKVRTVTNGVPVAAQAPAGRAALRAREGLPADAPAIVALGRLEPQKCPLRFLEHATRIRRSIPAAQLRWIGSGRMSDEWDRAVAAGGLEGTVRRFGWREDGRDTLPAYDVFLHTAAFEGLPLAILEAMAAGLPCVIERSVHEQLPADLRDCSLPASDDTDWSGLFADRGALVALGERARAVVAAAYSTATMARAYETLYRETCRPR